MDGVKDIEKYGKEAQGKRDMLRHLSHEKLTMKQGILAKCFDCCGFYADGKKDCQVPACPLYGFMPYRKNKEQAKTARTERQVEAARKLGSLRAGARSSTCREGGRSISDGLVTTSYAKEV